ncbi:hypothetical protein Vadar_032314 [Vaccinium darrowii]|uniref:Uncharacterized protein n=1 Tax=Vaccinium darrowii TaxID=229202 RepID=A0ACB7YHK2_9ERIC|nr:hypothetical protein Vadar_032314 [Vaccinium darrowii]
MNQLILLFPLLSVFCYCEAQPSLDQTNTPSTNNFSYVQSIVAVIIAMFVVASILILILAMYTNCCNRTGVVHHNQQQNPDVLIRPIRTSGIDKVVIESLPFFKFSALKGLKGGLECAVCLAKFEDIEILRLLPKCKHAFHIDCVDKWLENHSSCPLCRQKINVEDITYSNSLRFLSSQSEVRQDSNVELFVQREDNRHGSSRFSIGSSFRKSEKGVAKEDEFPIREDCEGVVENDKSLHKFNHKIIMSNAVLKSRWSNLSSSDLLFLNSEMLGDVSSNRFPPLDSQTHEISNTWATEEGGISKIKEETEGGRVFESNDSKFNQNDSHPLSSGLITSNPTRNLHLNEKRSMSEIPLHSRLMESSSGCESNVPENAAKEERLKRLWLPIAWKTVQWYANWDKKSQRLNYTRESLNV